MNDSINIILSVALEDVFYIYAVFIFLLIHNNEACFQRWEGGVGELFVLPPDKHHFLLVLCDFGSVMMRPEKLAKQIDFQFLLWCHPTEIMSVGVWGGGQSSGQNLRCSIINLVWKPAGLMLS